MITGHLKRHIWQNGGAITRSLHGHFKQLARDIYARRLSFRYLRPMQRRTRSPAPSSSRGLPPWSAEQTAAESPARRAVRLERFQAGALRNHPTLHVAPERNA